MIKTRKDLKRYINDDILPYVHMSKKVKLWIFLTRNFNYFRVRFLIHLRKAEYYKTRKIFFLLRLYHESKKNRIGNKFNWQIPLFTCENGLHLGHPNIVINPDARIGPNVLFNGNNCVGRKSSDKEGNYSPTIGANVVFGFGSVAIGGITIADNCIIGANCVVNKDCKNSGSIILGIPGKIRN